MKTLYIIAPQLSSSIELIMVLILSGIHLCEDSSPIHVFIL